MKRTDAEAHDGNRFTEGNPTLGVPATVVDASIMNNLQEEIVNVVLDAGITLNGAIETQLLQALKILLARGGDQLKVAIANNQVAVANVTGLIFDKTVTKAATFSFDIFRSTSGSNKSEVGMGYATHNPTTDTWHLAILTQNDDAAVPLTITSAGQVQYTSDNMAGTGYTGFIRVSQILKLNQ